MAHPRRGKSGTATRTALIKVTGEPAMRHKNSLQLFDYWNEKRAGRPAPCRTDIEPADIRTLLPGIFICELSDQQALAFRLAGTALCAMFGQELKGADLGGLWLTDGQRNARRTGAAVLRGATPAILSLDGLSHGGRVIQAEMVLLPVTGPSGARDRLIGIVSVFEPPYWIGHEALAGFSTTGIRFLDQARDPVFLGNRPEIDLPTANTIAAATASVPAGKERRRIGHLTLLEGGRQD